MKYIITIEETNAKDIEVETGSAEKALKIVEQEYRSSESVLDQGEYQCLSRETARGVRIQP